MATSGSSDFTLDRDQIITEAYALIGVGVDGEVLSDSQVTEGARALNLMLKTLSRTPGLLSWLKTEGSFTLTDATASYTMGSGGTVTYRPLRILSMRYRNTSGTDLPMTRLSREEYFELPIKTTAGIPTQFYYDPGRDSGTLYLWPVKATITTESVRFTYERTIEDFDASTDNADLPQEWLETLIYNLAVRLGPRWQAVGPTSFAKVEAQAGGLLAAMLASDQEDASIYLQPSWQGFR